MIYILFGNPVATVKRDNLWKYRNKDNASVVRNYEAMRNHEPEDDDQCFNEFDLIKGADKGEVPFEREELVSVRGGELDGACFGVVRQDDGITVYRIDTSNPSLSGSVVTVEREPRQVRITIVADEGYVAESLRDIATAIEDGRVRFHIEDAHYDAQFDTDMGEDDGRQEA